MHALPWNTKLEIRISGLNQYIARIACGVNGVFEIFSIGFCASKDFHATLIFFLKKWIIYVSPQKSEPPSWKFYYSWDPVSVRRSPPTFYNNFQFPSNTVEFWFNNFIKSFYNFFLYKEKIFRSENIWNRKITVPQSYSCWDWWTARISGRMPKVSKLKVCCGQCHDWPCRTTWHCSPPDWGTWGCQGRRRCHWYPQDNSDRVEGFQVCWEEGIFLYRAWSVCCY